MTKLTIQLENGKTYEKNSIIDCTLLESAIEWYIGVQKKNGMD